jgi:hypothetical protein
MTLIRANTLAFDLIGKDGPHGIIKICFGNMNLVFGSEVALLGFGNICFEFSLECIDLYCPTLICIAFSYPVMQSHKPS